MLKRLLLACLLAMLYVLPGVADVSENSKCNNETFGIFSGVVDVEAVWTANKYTCEEGKYLDVETATCKSCTGNGAYCPGFENLDFNDTNLGLESCNSEQDGYGWLSRTGATSNSECYKESSVACSVLNAYTGGNGNANYANESVDCIIPFSGDRTQCVPVDDNACDIVSLACSDGYKQETVDGSLQCVLNTTECGAGTYLPIGATECAVCPEDSYCPGYSYVVSEHVAGQGIFACLDGLKSPEGARSENDCGRLLHVGDNVLHLHKDKRTEHSLVIKVDGIEYYADTTPVSDGVIKTINPKSSETLRVKIGDIEYFVHETIYE